MSELELELVGRRRRGAGGAWCLPRQDGRPGVRLRCYETTILAAVAGVAARALLVLMLVLRMLLLLLLLLLLLMLLLSTSAALRVGSASGGGLTMAELVHIYLGVGCSVKVLCIE